MSDTETTPAGEGTGRAAPDEARELAAAERLTTAPADAAGSGFTGAAAGDSPGAPPVGIGVLGWLRWFWRQLTSMRVALFLLFLLSLAAVPGSLIPQTAANSFKVDQFRAAHSTLSPIYDKLGLFHVYSSVWFSAIYILLFVSLAGCIVPRCWQFLGVLRSRPPAAPRNLVRLPVYATWRTRADQDAVLGAAESLLRRRRFRVGRASGSLGSEKGYLREVGNLLFHVALFGVLISFAVGKLYGGQGTAIVIEGQGFTNTLTQYDDFTPSTFYTAKNLDPFGFTLNGFDATYQTSGDQVGTARSFVAHIHYWTGGDSAKQQRGSIEVNHPLQIGGSNVYLTAHGYAPEVTVKDAQGNVAYSGPVVCLPQDANLTSTCVIKVPDALGKDGKETQLGFSGLFAPTMVDNGTSMPHSAFPSLLDPQLYLTGFTGDLGMDAGTPQSVYELDTSHMKQFKTSTGSNIVAPMKPGDTWTLPGGAGSVTFTGIKQWANFTVAHNPGTGAALGSAVLAILGLIGSLFVQRRRIWVRALAGPDGTTTVEVAGLARSESARIAEELAGLALDLQEAAPAEEDPDPDPDPSETPPEAPGAPETPASDRETTEKE
jgi:cytochrome c biogenesis protein